jgi:flagellar motor switch protein FliM
MQFSQREVTEIEQVLLSGFFQIVLRDLHEAWKFVTPIEFITERIETEPQFLQILAPTEAVVAVAIEIRLGDAIGMMNIAMPSIIIKMMRQRFDQQWLLRKASSTDVEQARVMKLIQPAELQTEAMLSGPHMLLRDLIDLDEGDVLGLEFPVGRPIDLLLTGSRKYRGEIVNSGSRAAFRVLEQTAGTS